MLSTGATGDDALKVCHAQIAREFKDEPALYFPHNLDFRGRAYPMHGNLNHLGSDVSRGMLQFAEARPLGERGLYWLHVQVSFRASQPNITGSAYDAEA